MSKKKQLNNKTSNIQAFNDFDIDIQSCSTTDCTGLIPTGPQSDAEIEHYNQLYHFLPEHISDSETH